MPEPVKVKPRSRAGSGGPFQRRYLPVDMGYEEGILRPYDDPCFNQGVDERLVWTALDCDGKIILVPGFHTVNYFARVLCTNPWSDIEYNNPGYVW